MRGALGIAEIGRESAAVRDPNGWQARIMAASQSGGFLVLAAIFCADNVGRLHELSPLLARIPVAKLLLPVGAYLLLRRADATDRLKTITTPPGLAFVAFTIAIALSVPTSLERSVSLSYFLKFLFASALYVLLVAAAPRTVPEFRKLLRGLPIAMILFGVAMLRLKASGMLYADGRLSSSSTYDPNDIALVAASCFPFSTLLLSERSRFWRWTGIAGMAMSVSIVILSASRGGALALGAVLLVALFGMRRNLPRRWKLMMVPATAAAIYFAPPVFIERLTSLGSIETDYNLDSPSGRIEIWKRGYRNFLEHPFTGVGTQEFMTADGLSPDRTGSFDQRWATAHNMVVLIAVELGGIGIVAYLAMYFTTYLATRRARQLVRLGRASPELGDVAEALQLALVGFFVAGMFLSAGYSPIAMTLAAFGMTFWRLAHDAQAAGAPPAVADKRLRGRGAWSRYGDPETRTLGHTPTRDLSSHH